ncbi:tRNA lysidine(34) synthetase TilS [Confluentibacter flavum]|uniref:tRNA(Ile)-lysidine synthase n=1 Tax=Confluentibacter flavum TaxID=1909700 RepID=A0A2N3HMV8_9FLAO|nr:tRNA lysidine(34) synthetase TilS [Confluentibacter flavum]PKQ46286.1 tRNA lysidine(34) synthetase TilS [Confluentibacter flavum]
MLHKFQSHINTKFPFFKDKRLLIAISGGMDSVVLTYLCHELQLNIALAHCNFNLRGKESDADEDFVLQLAEDLDLEVFVESFDTNQYAKDYKRSIQMAARELRYNWFLELGDQLGFDYILTAHHADDNLETFLINFTRGTGLEGLTGIPEINGKFVRPLLPFSREDLETFAKEKHIEWRDDSSNASTKYLRNKLRHDVIPILKEINPNILRNFETTQLNLKDSQDIVADSIDAFLKKASHISKGSHAQFKISEFKRKHNPKAYLFEVFKDFGFTEWNDVLNLLDAQSGKQVFSEQWRLIKDRDYLLLSDIQTKTYEKISILKTDKNVEAPFGTLVFNDVDTVSESPKHTIYVDRDKLHFPLTLRTWEEGDVFFPLGMSGKKKLSKYFKDEKLSLLDKENTWLLCFGDDIVWVIGKRADDRFKVTENTKQILKIELK